MGRKNSRVVGRSGRRRRLGSPILSTDICPTRKRPYYNKIQAETEMARLVLSDSKVHKIPVRAYECHKCHRWHLTSRP